MIYIYTCICVFYRSTHLKSESGVHLLVPRRAAQDGHCNSCFMLLMLLISQSGVSEKEEVSGMVKSLGRCVRVETVRSKCD